MKGNDKKEFYELINCCEAYLEITFLNTSLHIK